jgi:hypothetical protein
VINGPSNKINPKINPVIKTMIPKNILKVVLSLSLISVSSALAADDVDAILKQISGESSGGGSSSGQNTSLKKSKSSDSGTTSRKKSTQASAPSIKVWNPKDKLPADIAGQGVAGSFAIIGEYVEGGALLIPGEDAMNPFARQYILSNVSSGFPRGTHLDFSQRRLINIPMNRPLIFVGRGIVPGTYVLQAK